MDLTLLIPCLNEEKTLGQVIQEAKQFLEENQIDGEVLIADNGSTDKSVKIADNLGARVVEVKKKGYGSALREGTKEAKGKFVIMGDADMSYDFYHLKEIYDKLTEGYELVIGNRLNKNIEKGAMPFLHRYVGTPVISFIGNVKYGIGIQDFNSGLRGYQKDKLQALNLSYDGMEYATEMLIQAKKKNLKMTEVDIAFRKDKRDRKPHLRPFRDGARHLKVLMKG